MKHQNGVPYIVYHGWDANDSAGWGSRKVFTQLSFVLIGVFFAV